MNLFREFQYSGTHQSWRGCRLLQPKCADAAAASQRTIRTSDGELTAPDRAIQNAKRPNKANQPVALLPPRTSDIQRCHRKQSLSMNLQGTCELCPLCGHQCPQKVPPTLDDYERSGRTRLSSIHCHPSCPGPLCIQSRKYVPDVQSHRDARTSSEMCAICRKIRFSATEMHSHQTTARNLSSTLPHCRV